MYIVLVTVKSFRWEKFRGFCKKDRFDQFDGMLIRGFCISCDKYKGQNYCLMEFDFIVEGEPRIPRNLPP